MLELLDFYFGHNLYDPVSGAWTKNNCFLRSYQADALRNIFDAVMSGQGGRFAVMFPRQSGKNETQAQLEAAVMAASQHTGGSIIKIIPTEKNQGKVSTERLTAVLRGTVIPEPSPTTTWSSCSWVGKWPVPTCLMNLPTAERSGPMYSGSSSSTS